MATADANERGTRKLVLVAFAVLTVAGVALSTFAIDRKIPPRIYLFGFLGSMVYVFTSLAEKFDEEDRYTLEISSKGIAAFPLAAGVYLLAFAFPVTDGSASGQSAERIISGLVFLSGAYVSLTLRGLGSLARRMLGVREEDDAGSEPDAGSGDAETDREGGVPDPESDPDTASNVDDGDE